MLEDMFYNINLKPPREYSKELLDGENKAIIDTFDYVTNDIIDFFKQYELDATDGSEIKILGQIYQEVGYEVLEVFKEYLQYVTREFLSEMIERMPEETYQERLAALKEGDGTCQCK